MSAGFHDAKKHAAHSNEVAQVLAHIHTEGPWKLKRQEQRWGGLGSISTVETAKTNIRVPFLTPDNDNYAVVTQDAKSEKVDRIAVVADQKTLFDLVLYGAYSPESLIAQLIANLGNYRLDILKRAQAGFQTELHAQKLKITVFSQRLFAAFLSFERLIHVPTDEAMPAALAALEQQINDMYATLAEEPYGPRLTAELEHTRDNLCTAIRALRAKTDRSIDDCKKLLIGTARIVARQGQTLNRTITEDDAHSTAVLRGNLNNYFENLLLLINNYDYDFNKPIFPQHQGLLSDMPVTEAKAPQGVVLSDLVGIRDLDALALIVNDISKPLAQRRADLGDTLKVSTEIAPLPIVNNPKWHGVGGALGRGLARFGSEMFGFVRDTVLIPRNIYRAVVPAAEVTPPPVAAPQPTSVTQAVTTAKKPRSPWYARLGKIAVTLGKRVVTKPVIENINGSRVAFREKSAELDNYLTPQTFRPSDLFILPAAIANPMHRDATPPPKPPTAGSTPEPTLLHAPYTLSDHGSSTLLGAAAHGAESFTDTLVHNIHGKNPIIGAIYTLLAASSAGAVWFGLGGPEFAGAMAKVSAAVSHSSTFGGVSTGSTVGQVSVAVAEAIAHGHQSWVARGLKMFSENPITITSGMIAGFAVGYVITELAHIPFISSYLDGELGSIPEIAQFFAGLKIAAVSFEIFLPPAQRTILKGKALPELPPGLRDALLKETLQSWETILPFLDEAQKTALKAVMGDDPEFTKYKDRLDANISDLVKDGTFLKMGGALAYLSNAEKFAILNACEDYKQHQQLHELLFPHAKRSVMGETAFRILRPPVRVAAAVGLAATAPFRGRNKVGKTLKFAAKELGRAVVRDVGQELVGDSLKAGFKMARTAIKAGARVVKSTGFVAPLSLVAKTKKMGLLAARRFKAKPVSAQSPIEIGNLNLLKKRTGDAVDAARTRAWFHARKTWHKGTTTVNKAFHDLEHSVLHGEQQHPASPTPAVVASPSPTGLNEWTANPIRRPPVRTLSARTLPLSASSPRASSPPKRVQVVNVASTRSLATAADTGTNPRGDVYATQLRFYASHRALGSEPIGTQTRSAAPPTAPAAHTAASVLTP